MRIKIQRLGVCPEGAFLPHVAPSFRNVDLESPKRPGPAIVVPDRSPPLDVLLPAVMKRCAVQEKNIVYKDSEDSISDHPPGDELKRIGRAEVFIARRGVPFFVVTVHDFKPHCIERENLGRLLLFCRPRGR
jgi:hypothetical protein